MNEFSDESFRIDSDQRAEWALGKIAEAKAELAKWEAFYAEKLEAVRKDTQSTVDYMTGLLHQYFSTQEHKVTKTGIHKYALPSGELIMKPGGIDYKRDADIMLRWCEEHLPAAIKVKREAGWAEVKAYIKETGEIPEGVELIVTEPTFTIKEAK